MQLRPRCEPSLLLGEHLRRHKYAARLHVLLGCDMLTRRPPADGSFDIVEKAVWGWASESVDYDVVKCVASA